MRIIPVLDIRHGQVVRGIAGRRSEYLPIQSTLVDGCGPLEVACAFRRHLGLDEIYIADLDAIEGGRPSFDLYAQLNGEGFSLWVDFGVRTSDDAVDHWLPSRTKNMEGTACRAPTGTPALGASASSVPTGAIGRIVVGSETLESPDELPPTIEDWGVKRVIVSIDLKGGRPTGRAAELGINDPMDLVRLFHERGARRFLFLDLASVGTGQGVSTAELAMQAKACHGLEEVYVGGGVRDQRDLEALTGAGLDGVLIASALHDGRIGAEEIKRIAEMQRDQQ